ncbi:cupin domain-containing protein [Neotabrizicola sp. VNH66]|uniref:cupin domain-containing protein n=1 Tax=Neotabrizicola sp. VNH66 TaxID=3400918 RepID=UPI003C040D99
MTLPVFPVHSPDTGIRRQVLAESPAQMVVSFRFESGAEGKPHNHPHVQSTYVAKGVFEFHRAGETFLLRPGDSLVIPSGVTHGCTCLEEGELIDVFSPRRDDFL